MSLKLNVNAGSTDPSESKLRTPGAESVNQLIDTIGSTAKLFFSSNETVDDKPFVDPQAQDSKYLAALQPESCQVVSPAATPNVKQVKIYDEAQLKAELTERASVAGAAFEKKQAEELKLLEAEKEAVAKLLPKASPDLERLWKEFIHKHLEPQTESKTDNDTSLESEDEIPAEGSAPGSSQEESVESSVETELSGSNTSIETDEEQPQILEQEKDQGGNLPEKTLTLEPQTGSKTDNDTSLKESVETNLSDSNTSVETGEEQSQILEQEKDQGGNLPEETLTKKLNLSFLVKEDYSGRQAGVEKIFQNGMEPVTYYLDQLAKAGSIQKEGILPFVSYSPESPYKYLSKNLPDMDKVPSGTPAYHLQLMNAVIEKYLPLRDVSVPVTDPQIDLQPGQLQRKRGQSPITQLQTCLKPGHPQRDRALQVAAVLNQVGDGLRPIQERDSKGYYIHQKMGNLGLAAISGAKGTIEYLGGGDEEIIQIAVSNEVIDICDSAMKKVGCLSVKRFIEVSPPGSRGLVVCSVKREYTFI